MSITNKKARWYKRMFEHTPVLLSETIDSMNIRPDGIYVDGTVGGAGHGRQIASRLTSGHLYCLDRDIDAIEAAGAVLAPYADRVTLILDDFADMGDVLASKKLPRGSVDGILLDLGVSSHQIDEANRGFSYMRDAPLDMRMDRRQAFSAADIVATYSETELARIFTQYGEERYAARIASAIVSSRAACPIETTGQLVAVIEGAVPPRMGGGHPAKRVFQALRIECNGELTELESFLADAPSLLAPRGRLCIISFHSLEDRAVKQAYARWANPCTCPPDFPVCVCGRKPIGRVITKKPITAAAKELRSNSRAASAKLRVFERYDINGL